MVFDWAMDCDLCESLVEGHSHLPAKVRECPCGLEFRPYAVFEGTVVVRPVVCSYCLELEGWLA